MHPIWSVPGPLSNVKGGLNMAGQCTRCRRRLSDPMSIKRGMGPVCWAASGGETFEAELEASDEEWARREALLRAGGEIDLGCNWEFDQGEDYPPTTMRVSVRFWNGAFEAYGALVNPADPSMVEVVFLRSDDLRAVYEAAVLAGPHSTARAAWRRRQWARKAHRAA